jgi:hypothetical protein
MSGLDALQQTKDGGPDVSDSHCLHQLRIIGVQVKTKLTIITESCQLLDVSNLVRVRPSTPKRRLGSSCKAATFDD